MIRYSRKFEQMAPNAQRMVLDYLKERIRARILESVSGEDNEDVSFEEEDDEAVEEEYQAWIQSVPGCCESAG
jgi:hypothetical protein